MGYINDWHIDLQTLWLNVSDTHCSWAACGMNCIDLFEPRQHSDLHNLSPFVVTNSVNNAKHQFSIAE